MHATLQSRFEGLAKVAEQVMACRAKLPEKAWHHERAAFFWKLVAVCFTVLVIIDMFGTMHSLLSRELVRTYPEASRTLASVASALLVFALVVTAGRVGRLIHSRPSLRQFGMTKPYLLALCLLTMVTWIALGCVVSQIECLDALAHCLGLYLQSVILALVLTRIIGLESKRHPHVALFVLNLIRSPGGWVVDNQRAVRQVVDFLDQAGWEKPLVREVAEIVTTELQKIEVRFSFLEVTVALLALAVAVVGPLAAGSTAQPTGAHEGTAGTSDLLGLGIWQRSVLSIIVLVFTVDATLWYGDKKLRHMSVLTLMLVGCRQYAWENDSDPPKWEAGRLSLLLAGLSHRVRRRGEPGRAT